MLGTGYFYGSIAGRQISDDGGVLASVSSCCRSSPLNHVWLLRDGIDGLTGFPTISQISYRYDDEADALTVRVKATSPNGLETIFSVPHTEGVHPHGFVPSEQSPRRLLIRLQLGNLLCQLFFRAALHAYTDAGSPLYLATRSRNSSVYE